MKIEYDPKHDIMNIVFIDEKITQMNADLLHRNLLKSRAKFRKIKEQMPQDRNNSKNELEINNELK